MLPLTTHVVLLTAHVLLLTAQCSLLIAYKIVSFFGSITNDHKYLKNKDDLFHFSKYI
jgi:hypothetical protein